MLHVDCIPAAESEREEEEQMHRLPTITFRLLLVIAAAGTLIAIGPDHALADPAKHPHDYLAQSQKSPRSSEPALRGTGLLVDDWFRDKPTVVHARHKAAKVQTVVVVDDWFRAKPTVVHARHEAAKVQTVVVADDWFRDPR